MGRPKKSAATATPDTNTAPATTSIPPDAEPHAPMPPMSKAEACRAALAAGIEDAREAIAFAKDKFGVELKPTDWASHKSKAKAAREVQSGSNTKDAAKAKAAGRPKGGPKTDKPATITPDPSAAHVKPPEATLSPSAPPSALEALEAMGGVKELVERFGAEAVRKMVDLVD